MNVVRSLTLAGVLVTLMIGSFIYITKTLGSASQKLEKDILQIENNIGKRDWEGSEHVLATIKNDWEKTENTWKVLLDHDEIDNIDTTLSRMTKFIETKNTSLALAEAEVLKKYVKHIPEKESLSVKNIF